MWTGPRLFRTRRDPDAYTAVAQRDVNVRPITDAVAHYSAGDRDPFAVAATDSHPRCSRGSRVDPGPVA